MPRIKLKSLVAVGAIAVYANALKGQRAATRPSGASVTIVYNPTSGDVTLHLNGTAISAYTLQDSKFGPHFIPAHWTAPLGGTKSIFTAGGQNTGVGEVKASGDSGAATSLDLGDVLPAGLHLTDLTGANGFNANTAFAEGVTIIPYSPTTRPTTRPTTHPSPSS